MRKNGFMLYELVISFGLAFAILLIIFNTSISLNQKLTGLYVKNKIASQSVIFNKKIGNDFTKKEINSISKNTDCTGDYCYIISYKYADESGSTINETKNLNVSIAKDNQYIEYGISGKLEKIKFDEKIEVLKPKWVNVGLTNSDPYEALINLKIPMKYLNDKKDYGVDLFYLSTDGNKLSGNVAELQ